jgi:hypothetical protein
MKKEYIPIIRQQAVKEGKKIEVYELDKKI